jgi:uncharacterized protein (DUF488 family)
MKNNIYTIGHSNRSLNEFIQMLKSFNIQLLKDIRRFPGSKKFPYFNKSSLENSLRKVGINYLHSEKLGGRRKPKENSINDIWKNEAFRGFADYMETENFKNAIKELETLSEANTLAIMCSEALWWRCHRSLISDYLKSKAWKVLHIMKTGKAIEHPFSSAANLVQGKLDYTKKASLVFLNK